MKKLLNATREDIIDLVNQGKIINYKNRGYQVIKDQDNKYKIMYSDNKYSISLDSEFLESETSDYFFEGELLKTYFTAYLDSEGQVKVSKNEKYSKPSGNYFDTKDQALEHFNIALKEAETKYSVIREKYYQFCKDNKISIGYQLDGDTHGLIDYMYMSVESHGYNIEFKLE